MLKDYSKSLTTVAFDLTEDIKPPKDLFVEVRCKEDLGEVFLPESGTVNLQKNTTHLLRRNEAAHLIRQGVLHQTS